LFKINLNAGQRRGATLIVLAFVLTVIAGIMLSFLAVSWETNNLIGAGLLVFFLLAPVFGYGIYLFGQNSQEEAFAEDMTVPRQLLDMLREKGTIDILDLALVLEVPSIKPIVNELSNLELFNGIVDWEAGTISLLEPSVMASIENCKHCGQGIAVKRGKTVCPNCGTEYHYY
jgi:hypothetical protein